MTDLILMADEEGLSAPEVWKQAAERCTAIAHDTHADVDRVLKALGVAKAIEIMASKHRHGEIAARQAIAAKLRLEARMGSELATGEGRARAGGDPLSRGVTMDDPTLSDLGISRKESSRWQKQAKLESQELERLIDEAAETGSEISSTMIREQVDHKNTPPDSSHTTVYVRNFRGPFLWTRFKNAVRKRELRLSEGLAEAVEEWLVCHESPDDKRQAQQEVGL